MIDPSRSPSVEAASSIVWDVVRHCSANRMSSSAFARHAASISEK